LLRHLGIRFAQKLPGRNAREAGFAFLARGFAVEDGVAFGFGNPVESHSLQFQTKRLAEKPAVHAYPQTQLGRRQISQSPQLLQCQIEFRDGGFFRVGFVPEGIKERVLAAILFDGVGGKKIDTHYMGLQ